MSEIYHCFNCGKTFNCYFPPCKCPYCGSNNIGLLWPPKEVKGINLSDLSSNENEFHKIDIDDNKDKYSTLGDYEFSPTQIRSTPPDLTKNWNLNSVPSNDTYTTNANTTSYSSSSSDDISLTALIGIIVFSIFLALFILNYNKIFSKYKSKTRKLPAYLKWEFNAGSPIYYSPAINLDGSIVVGTNNGYVYSIYPDGTMKWKYKLKGSVRSSPSIDEHGNIYLQTKNGYLTSIDINGHKNWEIFLDSTHNAGVGIAITSTGYICVSPLNYNFFIVSPNGKVVMSIKDMTVLTQPLVDVYNNIIIGCYNKKEDVSYIYKIRKSGRKFRISKRKIGDEPVIAISPWIKGGMILATARYNYHGLFGRSYSGTNLYKLTSNGELLKINSLDENLLLQEIMIDSHRIYAILGDHLYSLSIKTGEGWYMEFDYEIYSNVSICNNGNIFIGYEDGLYEISSHGKILKVYKTRSRVQSEPLISPDGIVYVGDNSGYLYAIEANCSGSKSGLYTLCGHDIRHTRNMNFKIKSSHFYPPFINVDKFAVYDANNNGVFESDEPAVAKIILYNSGKGPAYGVRLKLRGFINKDINIGQIDKKSYVKKEIKFKVPIRVETKKQFLKLYVDAGEYSPEPITVEFYTQAPIPPAFEISYRFDDDNIGQSIGNGDGSIQPREQIEMHITLKNSGRGIAKDVEIEVIPQSKDIKMIKRKVKLGNLPPGGEIEGTLAFFVPSGYDKTEISMNLKVMENTGLWSFSKVINIPVGTVSEKQYVITPKEELYSKNTDVSHRFKTEIKGNNDVDVNIPEGYANPKSIGIIIANKHYTYSDIPEVVYAFHDAEVMKNYFHKVLGIPSEQIFVLKDAKKTDFELWFGTESNAKGRLYRLMNNEAYDVFIYYVGHGAPDIQTKSAYFVPVDCHPNFVDLNGYSLDLFYRNLSRVRAKSITIIIDACFSGISDRGSLFKLESPLSVKPVRSSIPKNFTVITATQAGETALWYPEVGHSLFTYFFLKALKGEADFNKDNRLTLYELKKYLLRQVPIKAVALRDREQHPQVIGNLDQVFVKWRFRAQ